MKILSNIIGIILLIYVLTISASDTMDYYSVMASDYKTPWYSAKWHVQPFTNAMLAGDDAVELWKKNAVGDDWYVREVTHKGKVFWTVLEVVKK